MAIFEMNFSYSRVSFIFFVHLFIKKPLR